jgi:hypothetical protein
MRRLLLVPLAVAVCAAPATTRPEAHASTIRVGGAPTAVAVGMGSVWALVGDARGERLLRLAPADGRVTAVISLDRIGTEMGGLAVGAGAVWAASGEWLFRVDASGDVRQIAIGHELTSVVATRSAVWVTRVGSTLGQLVRVDPASGRVVARTTVGGGPVAVVSALGSVWVANTSPSSVMRVDPGTNRVVATVLADRFSSSLAVTDGLVWAGGTAPPNVAAGSASGAVLGLDADGRVVRTIGLPRPVAGIAAAGEELWAIDTAIATIGRLDRISLTRGRIVATRRVGRTPVAVAIGAGAVWVANFGDGTIARISGR